MTCDGCGNKEAIRLKSRYVDDKKQEVCNKCAGLGGTLAAKKGGFMFQGKSLHRNGNVKLAKQVRQEYIGTDHDEVRGRDW